MKKNNLIIAIGIFALIVTIFVGQVLYPSPILRPGESRSNYVQSPDGLASLPESESKTLALKSISPWQSIKKDPLASVFLTGYELFGEAEDFSAPLRLVFTLPEGVNNTPFVFYEVDNIQTLVDEVTFMVADGQINEVEISALGPGKYYLFRQHQYTDALPLLMLLPPEVSEKSDGVNVLMPFSQSLYAVPYAHTADTELGLGLVPSATQLSATYTLDESEIPIDVSGVSLAEQNITVSVPVAGSCVELADQNLSVQAVFTLSGQGLTRPAGTWVTPPSGDWVINEEFSQNLRYSFDIDIPIVCQ